MRHDSLSFGAAAQSYFRRQVQMVESSLANYPLIDTHAHLDFADYDSDLEEVIKKSQDAGLVAIVSLGIEPADWSKTIAISQRFEIVHAALGLHPNSADQAT